MFIAYQLIYVTVIAFVLRLFYYYSKGGLMANLNIRIDDTIKQILKKRLNEPEKITATTLDELFSRGLK